MQRGEATLKINSYTTSLFAAQHIGCYICSHFSCLICLQYSTRCTLTQNRFCPFLLNSLQTPFSRRRKKRDRKKNPRTTIKVQNLHKHTQKVYMRLTNDRRVFVRDVHVYFSYYRGCPFGAILS